MSKLIFIIVFLFITLSGCQTQPIIKGEKAENIILMIGDGMGPGQINLLYNFLKHTKHPDFKNTRFAFERMSNKNPVAISVTNPHGNIVTDSACSATQLATGKSSRSGMIGLDYRGNPVETILEKAQRKDMLTGLVSDTRLTHATPASFAAHVTSRGLENEIASQMIEIGPDVLLSGGARHFIPEGTKLKLGGSFKVKSKRTDNRNLLIEAKKNGYQLVHNRNQLQNLSKDKKLLGLFAKSGMKDAIWQNSHKNAPNRETPNLLEMSQAAIKKLSKSSNGFFLMIEGGQIDWAGHANDAGTLLHEMLVFNETLNWVLDWIDENPNTLLVVTADHETGGFGMGYHVRDIPAPISLPGSKFKNEKYKATANFGNYNDLNHLYNQKISLGSLWKEFEDLPNNDNTADILRRRVKEVTGLEITKKQSKDVFKNQKNRFYDPKNPKLPKTLPKVKDYQAFYYQPNNIRTSLIARAISDQQNIVWGTGGHTSTSVHVYSYGKKGSTIPFSGRLSHPKIGQLLINSLDD